MLPSIPKISQIVPGITRILGMNPSAMTLQGTNSYLIGTNTTRLLIDTSNLHQNGYIDNLRQYLMENCEDSTTISDIIVTHWHPDHIGAVSDVFDLANSLNWKKPNVYKYRSLDHANEECNILKSDEIISLSKYGMKTGTLKVLFTPGHTDDHICLLLQPDNILFSGDLILGNGSTTFENLTLYMDSLKTIEKIGNSLSKILPGHGVEIDRPEQKIKEYIQHRQERIKQVFNALEIDRWQSEMEIISRVYDKEILENPVLLIGALKNQHQALEYLQFLGDAESRECTVDENKQQEHSFTSKMWKLSNRKFANL